MITVVGLGPGDPGLVTTETLNAIDANPVRFLRTSRHPTASLVEGATSFDDVYERADTFDDVYTEISDRLVAAAAAGGDLLYAVPGSPLILERTVQHLRSTGVELRILPAVSFLDQVWATLGLDPIESRVRLVDGHTFAEHAAGDTGPVLVAHAHNNRVLSDIKLAVDADDDQTAIILQRLGTPHEAITEVVWSDLDRVVEADHLTSVFIPHITVPVAADLMRSVELVHTLRRECPWDRQQTHESLRRHLLEETYEVLEAIDGVDPESGTGYADLEEELGDLWFQVLFHSELASEAGQFAMADVARGIHDKLVSRHPHVFGDAVAADAEAVLSTWEEAKVAEKNRGSIMDGIPMALPALALTEKVLKKGAATKPLDLSDDELRERAHLFDASEHGVAVALTAVVEVARRHGIDAEGALRTATADALDRFRQIEGTDRSDRWILG
ncbi:MAG: MazG family protein [Acidimicrobiales bacterium]|nr:MazG family protein [Acidimicrobiales bacterium]